MSAACLYKMSLEHKNDKSGGIAGEQAIGVADEIASGKSNLLPGLT